MLFKHTGMDIRFSNPIVIGNYWRWWERKIFPKAVFRLESLNELFSLTPDTGHWDSRLHAKSIRSKSNLVRNDYMKSMYESVTINLSHIASAIILKLFQAGHRKIACRQFHKMLYLSIKKLQKGDFKLHQSLCNPDEYGAIIHQGSSRLQQFLKTTQSMGLLHIKMQIMYLTKN
eukprot:UN33205